MKWQCIPNIFRYLCPRKGMWKQQTCENPDTKNTYVIIFNYTDINSFLQLLLRILYSFLALVYKRLMHCVLQLDGGIHISGKKISHHQASKTFTVAAKGIQQHCSLFNRGSKRGITKIALGFAGRNFLTPFPRSLFLKGRETLGMRLGLSKVVELLRIINKTESYFLIHLHSSSL